MRNIKSIKVTTDMFDDTKFKIIDLKENRDSINYVWFRCMALAGKNNRSGELYFSGTTPYTIETLSIEFNRPQEDIKSALEVLIELEMICITQKGAYKVKNFARHQNLKEENKDSEIIEKDSNNKLDIKEDINNENNDGEIIENEKCEDKIINNCNEKSTNESNVIISSNDLEEKKTDKENKDDKKIKINQKHKVKQGINDCGFIDDEKESYEVYGFTSIDDDEDELGEVIEMLVDIT